MWERSCLSGEVVAYESRPSHDDGVLEMAILKHRDEDEYQELDHLSFAVDDSISLCLLVGVLRRLLSLGFRKVLAVDARPPSGLVLSIPISAAG